MNTRNKLKIKIILAIALIVSISIILRIKINTKEEIAKIKESTDKTSIVEIKAGSKIYSKDLKGECQEVSNKNKEIELQTDDKNAPNNIENIETKILDNYVIIEFNKPQDNGSDYEYIVENDDKVETLSFHAESGICGYSYKINNNQEDEADEKINKIDDSPILIQNVNWNENYYLHIKTVDNNGNFSENKTFKINLPSNGVNIEYLDFNSNKTLAIPEKISGMINDSYSAKNLNKTIEDYTLVETTENLEGLLQRELINVSYKYAKNIYLKIKYINIITGEEILSEDTIKGYEGKEIKIIPKQIDGFICNNPINNLKMSEENQTISLLYNKTGKVIVSYVDETTNEKLCQDEQFTYSYGSEYSTNAKVFSNYELATSSENANGVVDEDVKYVTYYYKPKATVNVKYVDIDTNKILLQESLVVDKENLIKIKLKEIEGYKLIDDSNDDVETSIIDEIIQSLANENELEESNLENSLTTTEKENIKEEYEIVMNCDDSDYIIYYKKHN